MPSQNVRFTIAVDGVSDELRVVQWSLVEGISELFQLEVVVASENGALAVDDLVDKKAVLTLGADVDAPRYVHGIVSGFRQGDSGKKLTSYALSIVPKAWKLLHRNDIRIFQELTAPEIVERVLKGAGLSSGDDYRLALKATYSKREYCVQYRESDWAFISRLFEHEGIFYFFEHEYGKHVLVIADQPSVHAPIAGDATVAFRAPLGGLVHEESVSRFHVTDRIRTGKYTLRDFDFKKPGLLLESVAEASAFANLEMYDAPGAYVLPADGDALAKLRKDERSTLGTVVDGDAASERFVPGFKFTLAEHARESHNREWLITRTEQDGREPMMGEDSDRARALGPHRCRFEAIPTDVVFRPPHVTPRPSVRGVQSAVVTGPAGEEIHTDEHGRVKVQFHWDRLGKKDDKSSVWMRVSQLWAGEGWGAMFIPRIGQEVLVDFIDGDPDWPVIVGRLYHGTNVPPYALPANKTVSTIKSNSTPGGAGSNELRFEDKKGSEEVYLHGQKDWTIGIENDKNQTIGHDETRKVTNDRTVEVGHDQAETVGNNETFTVKKDRIKSIEHDESEEIGHDRTISVGNDHTETIGGAMALSIAKTKTEEVTEDSGESVGKSKTLTVGKDLAIDVASNVTTKAGSNINVDAGLDYILNVAGKIVITCGDAKVTIDKSGEMKVEGAKIAVIATGDVTVDSKGKVEVKATGDVKVDSTGKVEVKSSGTVDLNATGAVKVKGANVGIN